jgi:Cu/Zn superoxide dismutase
MEYRSLVITLALGAACAGCSSGKQQGLDALVPEVGGLVAQVGSRSSAIKGVVHVYDYKDGVQVQLQASNLIPGTYVLAFHERANCGSPNLFSAGDPWAPPSWTRPAGELLPSFIVNEDGNQNGYVAFVKGVSVDGQVSLRGRSVIIHWGNKASEAFPGQPNNRMACGVFETSRRFLLER